MLEFGHLEWSSCRSGKGGPVLGRNSVKSGRKADIMKFASILVPFNKTLLRGYFPWYLVWRTMATVELGLFYTYGGLSNRPLCGDVCRAGDDGAILKAAH